MDVNRDAELIAGLAIGASWREAAARAGCSRVTVYRRLQDENFKAQVEAAREHIRSLPERLQELYRALDLVRRANQIIVAQSSEIAELSADECKRHIANGVAFLEEWAWIEDVERDISPPDDLSAVNLVSEVYEHQTHGDTCTCVLGEAAA